MSRKHNLPLSPLAPRRWNSFDLTDPKQSDALAAYLRDRLHRLEQDRRYFQSEFDRLIADVEEWCLAAYAEAGLEPDRFVPDDLYPPALYSSSRHRLVLDEGVQGGWE